MQGPASRNENKLMFEKATVQMGPVEMDSGYKTCFFLSTLLPPIKCSEQRPFWQISPPPLSAPRALSEWPPGGP